MVTRLHWIKEEVTSLKVTMPLLWKVGHVPTFQQNDELLKCLVGFHSLRLRNGLLCGLKLAPQQMRDWGFALGGAHRGRKRLAELEFRWMDKLSHRGAYERGTGSAATEIVWLMP